MTYTVYITVFHLLLPVTPVHFLSFITFPPIFSVGFATQILWYKHFPIAPFCYLSTVTFLCAISSFVFSDLVVQKSRTWYTRVSYFIPSVSLISSCTVAYRIKRSQMRKPSHTRVREDSLLYLYGVNRHVINDVGARTEALRVYTWHT
jgi:hypothetical protein